jgi:2,3-bisphosphoglycerate-dependent phosphoglycerate mutase
MRIGIPVRVENDLRERTLAADPVDDFPSAVAATWRDFDFAHRGGESNRAAQSRITSIIVKILRGAAVSALSWEPMGTCSPCT